VLSILCIRTPKISQGLPVNVLNIKKQTNKQTNKQNKTKQKQKQKQKKTETKTIKVTRKRLATSELFSDI